MPAMPPPPDPDERQTAGPPSQGSSMARVGRVPLVGRERELAVIRAALDTVLAGETGALFLAGEAGIGKSRLLDETARLMTERGGLVAVGRCVDERGMPPYLPWLRALAAIGDHAGSDPNSSLGAATPAAPAVSLGLADLLLEVDAPTAVQPSLGPSPEQRRLRVFDAVTRTLASIADTRPLLLAFDDLQWSDESSNQLLRYVVTNLPSVPLLVAGAYREEEVAFNAELTRTIDELDRRRLLTTVQVKPLGATETAQLLAGLLDRPYPNLAAAIHAHSEGSPFFVEEVVRSLIEEGRLGIAGGADASTILGSAPLPLPRGVVALIRRRLERASARCRSVLEVAALAGRDISANLVARATGQGVEEVAALLNEAVRLAILRPGASDVAGPDFTFLHDRIRETIAGGIDPVRRRVIHGRLAVALEQASGPPDDLARLAALTHHFRLAHEHARAGVYAERLGDAAFRAHAYDEAVRAYRVAGEVIASAAAEQNVARGSLLLKLGDALLAAGSAEAGEVYAAAEGAFGTAGDRRGVARALHRRGTAHARREEHELAVACLTAAMGAWQEVSEAGAEPVGTMVQLGAILGTSLGRYEEAIAIGRRSLELATAASADHALDAHARIELAKSLMRAGQLTEGRRCLEPALALALQAGNPDLAAEVTGALANHAYWTADLDASERYARRRRELAVQARDPFALRHVRPWLANIALARGNWDLATTLIAEAEEDVARVDSPEPRAFLRQLAGLVAFRRGRYAEAVARLEEAIAGFRQSGPATLPWYIGCLAHAYLAAGDETAAERTAAETADAVAALPAASLPRGPALAQLGLIAVRRGDRADCRRWSTELRPYVGQHHWVLIDRVLGMLAGTLGDPAAAERHFDDAAAIAVRGGIRPELALSLGEQTSLRLRAAAPAQRAEVESRLRAATAWLRALGMVADADRLESGLELPDTASAAGYPAGLTVREVAVLILLTQGLTNREIGERLGITEKTVTNHLTHIFTKANLDNRAAAVAFALRHGLVR